MKPAPVINIPKVTGDARLNSSGLAGQYVDQTSGYFSGLLAPGANIPVARPGTTFYVTFCSLPVSIRPAGGLFNTYVQGTGIELLPQNAFDRLEVTNNNSVTVSFQLFIGFDRFVDKRLYLPQELDNVAVDKNYSGGEIFDLSGQQFSSFVNIDGSIPVTNGVSPQYIAIKRTSLKIFNNTTVGTVKTLILTQSGYTPTGIITTRKIGAIQSQTSETFINLANRIDIGWDISATPIFYVLETYQAIKPGFSTVPLIDG